MAEIQLKPGETISITACRTEKQTEKENLYLCSVVNSLERVKQWVENIPTKNIATARSIIDDMEHAIYHLQLLEE